MTRQKPGEWPALAVGRGPAMTRHQLAERLDVDPNTPNVWKRRTASGKLSTPFPKPAGYAIPPGAGRQAPVPYWFERDVIAFGKAFGLLDDNGRPVGVDDRRKRGGPARKATDAAA